MNIQGFQKMTLLDFPGRVACIVFTGGCNLRCPFCHNASLVRRPLDNVNMETEVLDYISKRKGIIDGVCITGGEPLLQPDLIPFMKKIKDLGLLVKLDTNGVLPERLAEVLSSGYVDYVAMDVKASKENYGQATGSDADVDAVDRSIKLIKNSGIEHEFRTTAVKGIHSIDEFYDIARWVGEGEKYFIQKFKDSGDILRGGCGSFTESEYDEILEKVREIIPGAILRG